MAADPVDKPKPRRRRTRTELQFAAAVAGGRRSALEALRDKLAGELARETGFHTVGLAKELRAVLSELEVLQAAADYGAGVSRVDSIANGVADELAQRRQRQVRGPAAAGS